MRATVARSAGLLLCALVALLLASCSAPLGRDAPVSELFEWQYRWADAARRRDAESARHLSEPGEWRTLHAPDPPARVPGKALLLLRARLPDRKLRDPTLAFDAVLGDFDV